jgi:FKBP-type peptidyl-prolyl cis-trans isomerase 2
MKKLLPALLILAIALSGCAGPQIAQYGDNATVDYTLRVDGQVLATSMADVANSAGIYNASMNYKPMTFQLLSGQGLIPGFVSNIVGMKVGESKDFSIAPADGFGPIDQSKIFNVSRYYNVSRFQEVPMSYFVNNNITVSAGKNLSSPIGIVSIYNFTNETVTLEDSLDVGQRFMQAGLPEEVVGVTNDSILIRFDVIANQTYNVTDPVSGVAELAKATYADEQTIVLDGNKPLAGKTLDVEVTLRSLAR